MEHMTDLNNNFKQYVSATAQLNKDAFLQRPPKGEV